MRFYLLGWTENFYFFHVVLYVFTREKVAQQTYERSAILNDLRELNLEMTSVRKEKDERRKTQAHRVTRTDRECPVCQAEYGEGNQQALVCFKTCGHCLCFSWFFVAKYIFIHINDSSAKNIATSPLSHCHICRKEVSQSSILKIFM